MSKESTKNTAMLDTIDSYVINSSNWGQLNNMIEEFLLDPGRYTKEIIEILLSNISKAEKILVDFYQENTRLTTDEIKKELFKELKLQYDKLGEKTYDYLHSISNYRNYKEDISILYELFTQKLPFPSNNEKLLFTAQAVIFEQYTKNIQKTSYIEPSERSFITYGWEKVTDICAEVNKTLENLLLDPDNHKINKTLEDVLQNPNNPVGIVEKLLLSINEAQKILQDFYLNMPNFNKIEIKKHIVTDLKSQCYLFVDTIMASIQLTYEEGEVTHMNITSKTDSGNKSIGYVYAKLDKNIDSIHILLNHKSPFESHNEKLIFTLHNVLFQSNCSKLNVYIESSNSNKIIDIITELPRIEDVTDTENTAIQLVRSPAIDIGNTNIDNKTTAGSSMPDYSFILEHHIFNRSASNASMLIDLVDVPSDSADYLRPPHRNSISSVGSFNMVEPLMPGATNEDFYINNNYIERRRDSVSGSFCLIDYINQEDTPLTIHHHKPAISHRYNIIQLTVTEDGAPCDNHSYHAIHHSLIEDVETSGDTVTDARTPFNL